MRKIEALLASFIFLSLAGCNSPKEVTLEKLDVRATLPGGWAASVDDSGDGPVAEIRTKPNGSRAVSIRAARVQIPTLDELKTAIKNTGGVLKTAENTPAGFGAIFTTKSGETQFRYVANLGATQIHCDPGPYFKDELLEKSVGVCKSLKK